MIEAWLTSVAPENDRNRGVKGDATEGIYIFLKVYHLVRWIRSFVLSHFAESYRDIQILLRS